jgi:hypothetical protein
VEGKHFCSLRKMMETGELFVVYRECDGRGGSISPKRRPEPTSKKQSCIYNMSSYELNYYMKMQFAKIIVLACEVIKLNSEYIIKKYHKIITTI